VRVDCRIVDRPELPPGCCFLSRTSDGPFVDTGLDVEDLDPIGRIYLAESTISDLAQYLGFAPPVASARARDRIAELERLLGDADSLIDALTKANESLTAAGYTPRPTSVVPAGSVADVLLWVADHEDYALVVERAALARDAELLEPEPRQVILDELDQYLLRKEEPHAHQAQGQGD
jgi:hypothetical protein